MKTIFNLNEYRSLTVETSYYKGIPIEYLDITRKILKANGYTCRVRYRGPRNKSIDGRHKYTRQSSCLKRNATTFTVYAR